MENFGKLVENSLVGEGETRKKRIKAFFDYIQPFYEEGGLVAVLEQFKELTNTKPEWVQADNPELADMRAKLQHQGGIVISNHPSFLFDITSIAEALKDEHGQIRNDMKILVSENHADTYKGALGAEHFVSTDELMTLDGFRAVIAHMKQGGLFVILPTGGAEIRGEEMEFKEGLGALLKRMDPDQMVYSFLINQDDVARIRKAHPEMMLSIFSETVIPIPTPNLNNFRDTDTYKVDEHLSDAEAWQKTLAGLEHEKGSDKGKAEAAALTQFYLEQFSTKTKEA